MLFVVGRSGRSASPVNGHRPMCHIFAATHMWSVAQTDSALKPRNPNEIIG